MSSGGKGGAGGSKSYNYYGTIAAQVHVGQMDELTGIIVDDRLLWSGSITRITSTNPVEITVPSRGIIRLYWGTEDQTTVDPVLLAAGNNAGHDHPAYTGICYFVAENFLYGKERTQAPSISIRGARAPVQSLITGTTTYVYDGQVNPFCVLAELLTNERFGLGLDLSLFDAASWQAAAEAIEGDNELTFVSPQITSTQAATSIAADLLVMCDGWLRAKTGTGLCEAGLFTPPEDINAGALALISKAMLTAEPDISPETWEDVQTTFNIRFRDRDYNFKSRSVRHDDAGALQRVGEVRSQDIERNYIVRAEQALNHGREYGRRFSVPGMSAKIAVRTEAIGDLRPGDHTKLDIQPEPEGATVEQIFRVASITHAVKGVSKLRLDSVRTIAPVAYAPAVAVAPPTPYESPCITVRRVFELAPGWLTAENFNIGVLAARPDGLVTDFSVLFDSDPGGEFASIGNARSFALKGEVVDDFTDAATTGLHIELAGTLDREIVSESPGVSASLDDTVLMIVLKATGDSIDVDALQRDYLEIFSVVSFTADTGDMIFVDALRGRQGTSARAFATGDEVWFIRRANLPIFTHYEFEALTAAGDPANLILQPGSMEDINDGCDAFEFTFPAGREIAGDGVSDTLFGGPFVGTIPTDYVQGGDFVTTAPDTVHGGTL